ncbi:MAG: filamentous hemagglutinin N-terminal domain-containing protein [Cyanobacteria bacterium P01_B01_bin.77]
MLNLPICLGCKGLRYGLVGLLSAAPIITVLTVSSAWAQVIPDASLGNEASTVMPTAGGLRLDGGAVRGAGVFHSFSDFNVEPGQQVYFANPVGIANILTRITGNAPSAIDGTLGVDGLANLFLLNPSGIVFGDNAQLDVAGSFMVASIDSLWVDGYEFSATQPDVPSSLLSVNVSPGIQYGANTGLLENRGTLAVNPQQNLTLLGGTVRNLGTLTVPGGQVELSGNSIDTAGGRIVTTDNNGDSGDIALTALGDITVGLLDTSSLVNNGGNIDVTSTAGSVATAGNLLSDGNAQAGDITITAAGDININGKIVTDNSITASQIADFSGAAGDITLIAGGDLDLRSPDPISRLGDISAGGLQSGQITLTSGGTLSTDNYRIINRIAGEGIGADIRISAQSMNLTGTSLGILTRDESLALFLGFIQNAQGGNVIVDVTEDIVLNNSLIFNTADFGTSDGGDISLNARSLTVVRTAGFEFPFASEAYGLASTADLESAGNGGDIRVTVTDSIDLVGSLPGPSNLTLDGTDFLDISGAGASIQSGTGGSGDAGNITLSAKQLTMRDGAVVGSFAFVGNGGDVSIVVDDIDMRGIAGILTSTDFFGQDAGNLEIQAEGVTLTDGANIFTSSISRRDAGDLTLNTQRLSLQNGSLLASNTLNSGDGGSLSVQAEESIEVIGTSLVRRSGIATNSTDAGDSGPLSITTRRLSVVDGGEITTATSGSGAGADIDITTGQLLLNNGQINASTTTANDGGNIRIRADESVELVGNGFNTLNEEIIVPSLERSLTVDNFTQGILTVAAGEGAAGTVAIETPELTAREGALVATTTLGNGAGGRIDITATNDLQIDGSLLATGSFTTAPSGDINLQTQRLRASGGAQAITTTFGAGQAGDLTVVATESVDLIDPTDTGIASGLLASSFETATGTGGNIQVTTGDFRIIDGATVTVSGEGEGDAGNIGIGARLLSLDRGNITATSASGEGGNIVLEIDDLLVLRNGSLISTTAGQAGAGGNGGNITVGDGFIIAIPGGNSDITANAFEGNGGRIAIATQGLLGIDFRENLTPLNDITASSQFGLDGDVVIEQFNPDLEPTDTVLPDQLASSDQITARCAAPANPANSLITTGRGGLPTDPRQLHQGSTVLHDWRRPSESTGESTGEITTPQVTHETLTEAQDWFVDDRGQVQLVASMSQPASLNAPACATAREAL